MLSARRTRARRRRAVGERGTTVLELAIVCAVLLVVLVPAMDFLITMQRSEVKVSTATTQQADARLVLNEVGRFLREAEYPAGTLSSGTNGAILATASANDIVFYAEINVAKNGSDAGTIYKVEYSLAANSTTLMQTVTKPTCSGGTCTYTTVVNSRPVVTDLMNQSANKCSGFATPPALFTYYQQQSGPGGLEPVQAGQSAEINYVDITALTGTSGSSDCTEVQSGVSLRNWRP